MGWGLPSCVSNRLPSAAATSTGTTLRRSEDLALHGLESLEGKQQFRGVAPQQARGRPGGMPRETGSEQSNMAGRIRWPASADSKLKFHLLLTTCEASDTNGTSKRPDSVATNVIYNMYLMRPIANYNFGVPLQTTIPEPGWKYATSRS